MSQRTKKDLEKELEDKESEEFLRKQIEEERIKSDRLYAVKLVETVVWTMLGVIFLGALAAMLRVIYRV